MLGLSYCAEDKTINLVAGQFRLILMVSNQVSLFARVKVRTLRDIVRVRRFPHQRHGATPQGLSNLNEPEVSIELRSLYECGD